MTTTLLKPGMIEAGFATLAQVETIGDIFVGMEADFSFIPSDPWWIPKFGQLLNVAEYPALFAKIGTLYGGDGTTTFRLPDDRGRVRAGVDNMGGTSANRLTNKTGGLNGDILGAAGGTETHILSVAQMPSHGHTGTFTGNAVPPHTHNVPDGATGGGLGAQNGPPTGGSFPTAAAGGHTPTGTISINSTGSGAEHNNVQPTITKYACILAYWPI